jgi:hypothetical protein
MVLGIILEKKNGGPRAWTYGPRIETVVGARQSAAHRRSRAWDLTVMAREARGGDGDLYFGWQETMEGLRWSGDGGPRWWPEFLDERALEVQR